MRPLPVVALLLAVAAPARAAVVVVANYTPAEVTISVSEADRGKQTVTLAAAQVSPVAVTGPALLVLPATPQHLSFDLEPYHAYVILPDPKTGRRLEGIELPGMPPERDARPEANPAPRGVLKIPVTLMVDEADPRADALWQGTLKQRLAEASAVLEKSAGVRFEAAGFAQWRGDPQASTVPELFADFQQKVKAPAGGIALGYTGRKVEEKDKEKAPFGASRSAPSAFVLMREAAPRTEPERVEALVHQLGRALGAVPVPDPGSVMRPALGDGLALHAQYKMRFDPLNALAVNIWADELRGGKVQTAADLTPAGRIRLRRVYAAIQKASPGDPSALVYLNEFDRDLVQAAPPKKDMPPVPMKVEPPPPPKTDAARDVIARAALAGLTAKARANADGGGVTGDELTAAYIRAAATAALAADVTGATPDDRVGGFLLGLAVGLDDTDALRADDATKEQVAAVETTTARDERREVLGNPTIRGRRDLCRRFAAGVGAGELLPRQAGEASAVGRTLLQLEGARPAGVGLPGLVADFAGIEFARQPRDDLARLTQLAAGVRVTDLVPNTAGLPDALSAERFVARFGAVTDQRFQSALDDIRTRVRAPAKK